MFFRVGFPLECVLSCRVFSGLGGTLETDLDAEETVCGRENVSWCCREREKERVKGRERGGRGGGAESLRLA